MAKPAFQSSLRGALLDMDGVVIDSEPILREAVRRLFAANGVEVRPNDCQPFLGTGEDHLLEGVAARHSVTLDLPRDLDRLYALYLELIPGKLKALPGVFAFLALTTTFPAERLTADWVTTDLAHVPLEVW